MNTRCQAAYDGERCQRSSQVALIAESEDGKPVTIRLCDECHAAAKMFGMPTVTPTAQPRPESQENK